jgi:hypothetical protein
MMLGGRETKARRVATSQARIAAVAESKRFVVEGEARRRARGKRDEG